MTSNPHETELSEICGIQAPLVDPTQSETKTLPHINGSNIQSCTGRLIDVRTAEADGMTSPKYRFQSGDVLYSKLRPNLRKVTVAPFEGVCSADMYPLTPNKGRVLPGYLFGLLLSDSFTSHALEHSARARMPKLNRADLFKFKCRLPPIATQRRIAAELDKQLALIGQAREAARRRLEAAA